MLAVKVEDNNIMIMHNEPISEVYLIDCLEFMKTIPDNKFDLLIADPPYGLGNRICHKNKNKKNSFAEKFYNDSKINKFDDSPPAKEYFEEMFRVSKNQIIFGGNYFDLPPTRCFVVWDKMTYIPTMAQVEYAWTSFDSPARLIKINSNNKDRIHRNQKPVELYEYLLNQYAKPNDSIFDPYMGSQSSRIAAFKLGYNYSGCEFIKDYFDKGNKRFEGTLFKDDKQLSLFQ